MLVIRWSVKAFGQLKMNEKKQPTNFSANRYLHNNMHPLRKGACNSNWEGIKCFGNKPSTIILNVSSMVPFLHPTTEPSSVRSMGSIVKIKTPLPLSFTKENLAGFELFSAHDVTPQFRTCTVFTVHIWVPKYGWFVQVRFTAVPFSNDPKEVIVTQTGIKLRQECKMALCRSP